MSTSINNLPNDDLKTEDVPDNNTVKKLTGVNQSHIPPRSELPTKSIDDVLQNLADNNHNKHFLPGIFPLKQYRL